MASTSSGIRKVINAGSPRRNVGAMGLAASLKAMTRASRSSTIAAPGSPLISCSISIAEGCGAERSAVTATLRGVSGTAACPISARQALRRRLGCVFAALPPRWSSSGMVSGHGRRACLSSRPGSFR
jgi:hypothetical protein